MEIKIDKKFFITVGIVVALCIASFFAGRYTRFKGVSGSGEQLVEGIILSRDTINTIADQLNIADAATKSADELGYAITSGLEKLQRGNEVAEFLAKEIVRSIENNKRNAEEIQSAYSGVSESAEYALELAISRAEEYERLIESLQQVVGNNPKNLQ